MYNLILVREAENNFARLPKSEQKKVAKKLKILKENPFIGKKLSGEMSDQYSLRAWPYRIIYQINNNILLIIVFKIAHRQGVYK